MIFDAIILAGTSSSDEEILAQEKVPSKAYLKLGDRTFLEHQVEVLNQVNGIRNVYVSGIAEKDWKIKLPAPAIFDEYEAGIIDKLRHFRRDIFTPESEPDYVVIVSCDVPLITKEGIERFIEKCKQKTDGELKALYYMGLVEKEVMITKFPDSNRSYMKMKDVTWCTGDTLLAKPSFVDTHGDVIDQVLKNRKSMFKAILVLSPMTVIKMVFRRLTLDGMNDAINKYLFKQPNSCLGILADDPELGMDADKPFQLAIVREYYANLSKKK
ncbi:MAG: NTP transferase domain-containing protein [Candidatus Heimdallarchaeaceae archaeon]